MRLRPTNLLFTAANKLGINRYFHRIVPVAVTAKPTDLISPIEGKIEAITPYTHDQTCIVKGKPISLRDHLGDYAACFTDGTVVSAYLAPTNKHFRLLPAAGKIVAIHARSGTAKHFQTILGAEKLLRYLPYLRHRNLLQYALTRNATHTTILETKDGHLALIAIGSLGVNHIHCRLEKGKQYAQGTIAGRFAVGSSFLLVASADYHITTKTEKVVLGEHIGHTHP